MSACACCDSQPADVMVRIEFADAVDVSPWCMDCAAPVIEQGYGEVVRSLQLVGGDTPEDQQEDAKIDAEGTKTPQ